MKTFHQQLTKQLIVAKSAAAVKEEKHKQKLFVNFRYKNNIFLQYFCFKYFIIYINYTKNINIF